MAMLMGTCVAIGFLGHCWGLALWGAVGGVSKRAKVEGSLVGAVSMAGSMGPEAGRAPRTAGQVR